MLRSDLLLCELCYLNSYRVFFFFFNDTATTEIYTLSLHDALPIPVPPPAGEVPWHPHYTAQLSQRVSAAVDLADGDRKSTRLNSSHGYISYAVFCLKKKKKHNSPFLSQKNKKQTNKK